MAKQFDMNPDGVVTSKPTPEKPTQTVYGMGMNIEEKNYEIPNLTSEEIRDPNSIIVEISTPIPIVVLFGARNSGKTMTLVRLTRYLKSKGFYVEPVRDFRPSNSMMYQQMCDTFESNVYSEKAAESTHNLNFMLVNISDMNGNRICQILEAPGEHYFDEKEDAPFPTYIHTIANNSLPKTWIFLVEKGWKNASVRQKYANKITQMFNLMTAKDKVILLCHKADIHTAYFHAGKPDKAKFYQDIKEQYPAIFSKAGGQGVFSKLLSSSSKDYNFVVFSAGAFSSRADGGQTYTESNEHYPKALWEEIQKTVKGSWF